MLFQLINLPSQIFPPLRTHKNPIKEKIYSIFSLLKIFTSSADMRKIEESSPLSSQTEPRITKQISLAVVEK